MLQLTFYIVVQVISGWNLVENQSIDFLTGLHTHSINQCFMGMLSVHRAGLTFASCGWRFYEGVCKSD